MIELIPHEPLHVLLIALLAVVVAAMAYLISSRTKSRMAQSESTLAAIIQSSVAGVVMIDERGAVMLFNPSAERIFGYKAEDVIGRNVRMLMSEPHRTNHDAYLARYLLTGERRIIGIGRRVEGLRRDGTPVPIELAVSEVMLGGRRRFVGLLMDITERKAAEVELERVRDKLNEYARELELKNIELGQTAEVARAASSAKSDFLAGMSHEIRTPLNAMLGMAELMGETALTPDQSGQLRIIRSAGQTLLEVINDILDLSKIEAGRMEMESACFSLSDVVRQLRDVMDHRAAKAGLAFAVRVDAGVPEALVGDPVRLKQVLINLVGNAVKFTPEGSVDVDVRAPEVGATHATLEVAVRDTGIGIPPGKLDAVFDSFSQADASTTRRFGGTGLGLSISRRIVEAMGGSIRVQSAPGQGSTFTFTVRLGLSATCTEAPSAPSAPPAPRARTARPLSILLAEDNADNRALILAYLKSLPHTVAVARNGAEAVEIFARGGVDLVLMDMEMPVMDGLESTRRIRAMEAEQGLAHTPVLALTAHALAEHQARSLDAGCDGHLAKPLSKQALLDALARHGGGTGEGASLLP
jgi:PAS domain S-box-containing protein